jgi:signal recognition particle GTPase
VYARELATGVIEHRRELDERISAAAQNWELKRLAVVDRNILRIAVFELLKKTDVPPRAALNEAIEIGKKYSTANSGAFINGVLDKILSTLPGHRGEGTLMFKKLVEGLKKTRDKLTAGLKGLFSLRRDLDDAFIEELEEVLYQSDMGTTTKTIIDSLREAYKKREVKTTEQVYDLLKVRLREVMTSTQGTLRAPRPAPPP